MDEYENPKYKSIIEAANTWNVFIESFKNVLVSWTTCNTNIQVFSIREQKYGKYIFGSV